MCFYIPTNEFILINFAPNLRKNGLRIFMEILWKILYLKGPINETEKAVVILLNFYFSHQITILFTSFETVLYYEFLIN